MFNGRPFLGQLEDRLRRGAAGLSSRLLGRHARWTASRVRDDGGYPARRGRGDLYYTDFALRTLNLCQHRCPSLERTAEWLHRQRPRDVVDSFNLLSCRRQLHGLGVDVEVDVAGIVEVLAAFRRTDGSFRATVDRGPSCYNSFLGSLCYELLDRSLDHVDGLTESVAELQRTDGGFPEDSGRSVSQTNTTGAALAVLGMFGTTPPPVMAAGVAFIQSMQTDDGGWRAHPGVPGGDLLSSFTAMTVLSALELLGTVDIARLGRFVAALSTPEGGFRSCAADLEVDIEYTYYGIGVAALLRRHADEEGGRA